MCTSLCIIFLVNCISPCFFYLVVYLGDQKKLESLEGYDADFNASDYSGRTALHVAASTGQVDLVKWLLGRGASVHSRDTNNETPLLAAVKAGHLEIVRVSLMNMMRVITNCTYLDPGYVRCPPLPDSR